MKKSAHVIAMVLASAAAFFVTPAGIALVHQYPFLAAVAAIVAAGTTYFNPKSS